MLKTEIRRDIGVFDELAAWWNSQPGPLRTPFLRSEWFRIWASTRLGSKEALNVLVVRDDDDPAAALVLLKSGLRLFSLSDGSSDSYDMVHGGDVRVAEFVSKWLGKQTFVALERVEGSSPLVSAVDQFRGWRIQKELMEPYIDLTGGIEAIQAQMGRSLHSNLRRAWRHLEALGEVSFDASVEADDLERVFTEAMALERRGWKGRKGVAVSNSATKLAFYTDLSRVAAEHGWLRLGTLRVDGRMVAFNYALEYRGRLFGILTSYDETLSKRSSPGTVLMWETVQGSLQRGVAYIEMGGDQDNLWSSQWTSLARPRADIIGYGSNPAGRLVRALAPVRRTIRSALR